MNRNRLKQLFKEGLTGKPKVYDTFGMTWGVSHVRIALGEKSIFNSREEFFKEVMLTDSIESSLANQKPWRERTDFNEWIEALEIVDSEARELVAWLKSAIQSINEYAKDWDKDMSIDFTEVDIPTEFVKVIRIQETLHSRFYINSYTGFISEDALNYFFLEEQGES